MERVSCGGIAFLSVLLILSLSTCSGAEFNNPHLEETPSSQNKFLGSYATFNCTSVNFTLLYWRIQDITHYFDCCNGINISSTRVTEAPLIIATNMTVPAEWRFHQEIFACTGFYDIDQCMMEESEDVMLQIQGAPGPITGFDGYNTSTMITFTWTAPTHLPGLEPCCRGYSINVTHQSSTDLILYTNMTSPNVTFDIEDNRLCDLLLVTVVASNVVGEGDEYIQSWSLSGYFETRTANTALRYNATGLHLDITVQIHGYCFTDLTNATFYLRCEQDTTPLSAVVSVNALSTDTLYIANLIRTVPTTHQDQRCNWDIALENTVDYRGELSTYDVISANVSSVGHGFVCIECFYLPSSPAMGCHVRVINRENSFSVNVTQSNRSGCVNVTTRSIYRVEVFDWNSDNGTSTTPAITISHVFIESPPLPLSATSSMPVSSPTVLSQPSLSEGGIAGISVLAVLVGILIIVVIVMVIGVFAYRKRDKPIRSTAVDEPMAVDACSKQKYEEITVENEDQLVTKATELMRDFYGLKKSKASSERDIAMDIRYGEEDNGDTLVLKISRSAISTC